MKDHLLQPAADALPNAAQDDVGRLGCKAQIQLVVHQDPQFLLCKALSIWLASQSALTLGAIPLLLQDLAFPLVECHKIHLCPIPQPVEVPLNGSTRLWSISYLVSPANLLRVQPVPSSRSLMKMLNRIGPSIDPWGTPLVTGLQLGFVQLIPTL